MLNIPQKKSTALAVLLVVTFIIEVAFVKYCKAETFGKRDYGVFLNADDSSMEQPYILILILVLSRTSGNIIRSMRNWQLAVMNIGMRKNGWMQQARTGRGL